MISSPLLFHSRSIISAVPARYSSAVPGSEWQPTSHRLTTSLSDNQSTSSISSPRRPTGTGCTSAAAGDFLVLSFLSPLMVTCFLFLMIWLWLVGQVTIQVQEVELVGGAQRQGGFLSTPGGHRVLGKQLSADNAESHRWPHASCHLSPDGWKTFYTNGLLLSSTIPYSCFCSFSMTSTIAYMAFVVVFFCLFFNCLHLTVPFVFCISAMFMDFVHTVFWNFRP